MTQKAHADQTVALRIPGTFQWLMIPEQSDPTGSVGWKEVRLQGQEALAVRASRKMGAEEELFLAMGGSRLRLEIDRVPLWRGEGAHVGVRQLVEDGAQHTYLPRVRDSSVLTAAIEDGVNTTAWEIDGFALADGWDEEKKRYRGLKAGRAVSVSVNAEALVVKAEVARAQMHAAAPPEPPHRCSGSGPAQILCNKSCPGYHRAPCPRWCLSAPRPRSWSRSRGTCCGRRVVSRRKSAAEGRAPAGTEPEGVLSAHPYHRRPAAPAGRGPEEAGRRE